MDYKKEEQFELSEYKSITGLDELVFKDAIDRSDQEIEPIDLHDFFETLKTEMQNQSFDQIIDMLTSVKITKYDDSFEEFEIANWSIKIITISDDPNFLYILLKYMFGQLMKVDDRYIQSLVQAGFVKSISRVYKEVQNLDCQILALKLAFIISNVSPEYRDEVFENFPPLHEQINPFTDELLFNEFILIHSYLEYDINFEMCNDIIDFLFHNLPYLLDKLKKEDKHDIDKRLLKQFYTCISILSELPFWKMYFLLYQDQIDNPEDIELPIENHDNSEKQMDDSQAQIKLPNPEFVDLLFQFIQESLLSHKKSLIKFACFTLYNTISFYDISDRIELILSLFQLQVCCTIPDVMPYVCDVFCLVMYYFKKNQVLIKLIDDHKLILKVIDRVFELFDGSSVNMKSRLFKVAYTILTFNPNTIPYFIECGLLDLILEMMSYEDSDFLRFSLLILDCVFRNEDAIGDHQFFDLFIENDGMNDLDDLMNQQFVSQNQELSEILLGFLMEYRLNSDDLVIEEA